MHHPDEVPALPGTVLPLPVPPGLAEAFGYPGEARFVGFSWTPCGDEVLYDDRRCSGTGASSVFLMYRRHPAVARLLQSFNLGSSDEEADHWLLIDRERRRASVAPKAEARAFLEQQHPPPPELTPSEVEETSREVRSLAEALAAGWQEAPIDLQALHEAIRQERQIIARLTAFLDQWQAREGRQP